MGKSALLVGATGLIGSHVLELLLKDERYERVNVLSRKPVASTSAKLINTVVDFDKLSELTSSLKPDDVFCCLGTTIRKAKTQEAFRQVDYHYPLDLAKRARQLGATQYLLVSALGANAKSSIFYNRVKGELEDAISHVDYKSIHIFRPSLLLGNRKESRSGEDAAKVFYRLFGFLIPKKFQAVDSIKVAKAMLDYAKKEEPGIYFHESRELQNF